MVFCRDRTLVDSGYRPTKFPVGVVSETGKLAHRKQMAADPRDPDPPSGFEPTVRDSRAVLKQ
jgi:hypothetical protein